MTVVPKLSIAGPLLTKKKNYTVVIVDVVDYLKALWKELDFL